MPLEIADQDIGGARVRMGYNTFKPDGTAVRIKAGTQLSAEQVRSIPRANRRALASAGFLEIYPTRVKVEKGERFIVQVKKDQFNVIEGRRLNDQPLSREEAEALAAQK